MSSRMSCRVCCPIPFAQGSNSRSTSNCARSEPFNRITEKLGVGSRFLQSLVYLIVPKDSSRVSDVGGRAASLTFTEKVE
jgi:hypothetical protein